MSKGMKIHRGNRRGGGNLLVAGLLIGALFFSAVGASAWQYLENDTQSLSDPIPMPEALPLTDVVKVPTPENTPKIDMPVPVKPGEEQPEVNAGAEVEPGSVVPASGRVNSSYFDDAVFIGDSVTTGISLYDVMSNTTVLAATGLNPQSVFTKNVITLDGAEYTAIGALEKIKPKKIYILIGANSLTQMPDDWMVENFDKLLGELVTMMPDSLIYLQSLTPIHEGKYQEKYTNGKLTNEVIRNFNEELKTLAAKHKVYYLDINAGLAEEDGGLSADSTPDGLHFNSGVYGRWFDYLKTHTVKK